jgi:uncharacterized protein YqgV (UPF0045/DUF77 family)
MTVAELIEVLKEMPQDAKVGKMVTILLGRDIHENVFKPFKKIEYKVELKGDNSVKNVILG